MDNNLGKNFNGFTIQRLLGEGGMANVYYAENSIGKAAAIKILKPSIAQDFSIQERFKQEALVMVRLKHPNIREVYDLVSSGSDLIIIMEYLEGLDLAEVIRKKGAIGEGTILSLLEQILKGLDFAHKQGIIHRDIKPSNLFYTKNKEIKLLDFGIAKIAGELSGQTQTGHMMGSPLYMSPEQVKSPKYVDHRTDVYSLGVTLYQLLTGKKPYDDHTLSLFEIHTKIVTEPLPKVTIHNRKLARVVDWSTQKDPNSRPKSARVLLDFLEDSARNPHPVSKQAGQAGHQVEKLGSTGKKIALTCGILMLLFYLILMVILIAEGSI